MIFYGIAAIFPLVMWWLNDYVAKVDRLNEEQKKKNKYRLTILAILPMFLLFVLRYKYVGVDTIGYVRFFENDIRRYSFAELLNQDLMRSEIGYRLYVKAISLLTESYTVYFLINGFVIFGTLLHFAKKYAENTFVFFFAFMTLGTYQFMETGLRQALAMALCLWAVDFAQNKKLIRFVLMVLLAAGFHKSALLFLIIYPLSLLTKIKINWMVFIYVVLAAVLLVNFTVFQSFFNQLLGYEYEIEETGNGGIFMLFVLVLCVFSLLIMHDKKKEMEGKELLIHLSLLSVIFWVLRLISRTAERISIYYMFGLYAYFSQAVCYDKDKIARLLKIGLILACLVVFVYRNIGVRYQFFWQGV